LNGIGHERFPNDLSHCFCQREFLYPLEQLTVIFEAPFLKRRKRRLGISRIAMLGLEGGSCESFSRVLISSLLSLFISLSMIQWMNQTSDH
jgi:hypothetical protein